MLFKENYFYHLTRVILAIVFIYASFDKIVHPQAFAQAVFNHQILPDFLINLCAIILPWMELILGLCLLSNRLMIGASFMIAFLMTLFMGVIMFNLARGLNVNCGCFSTSQKETMDAITLMRDMIFLCLSISLAVLALRKQRKIVSFQRPPKAP